MTKEKILVVDDDKDISSLIEIYLNNEGYEIVKASDGDEALKILDNTFKLVLLDIMMPNLDGINTCIKIRKKYFIPIIFLTAKSNAADKYEGFSVGADDYIIKPFNSIELIARVKANIRRYIEYIPNNKTLNIKSIIIKDLEIHPQTHKVFKSGREIVLTKTEFSILLLLAENRGIIFNIDRIYNRVWGEENVAFTDNTVTVHIRKLRKKIENNSKNPEYIKTIWGVGYKID